jgi:hypothetical protein
MEHKPQNHKSFTIMTVFATKKKDPRCQYYFWYPKSIFLEYYQKQVIFHYDYWGLSLPG